MSNFKVGDLVKCIDANNTRLMYGHSYEVAETGSGWVAVYITDDEKDIFSSSRFVKLEGAEDMQTIKVGDKVTCIDNQYLEGEIKVGDIYTVSGFCEDAFYLEEKDQTYCFNKFRFKLAESNQPDIINNPKHYQIMPGVEVIHVRRALIDKIPAETDLNAVDEWSRAWEHLTRAWSKNGLEDFKKAQVYLGWLIERLESK